MTKKSIFLAVCTLIIALCLVGCELFQSDTTQLKGLLEDKYGEKFGVESYYYAGDMWAICYPESDPTLLFQVRTDGNVTKISHDYYLQNVVARQVEKEYESLIQQVFPESYLSVELSASDYEGQTADRVTLASMIQYNNSSIDDEDDAWTHIIMNIFVDKTQMSEDNVKEEYALIKDEIGSRVANDVLPDTIVKIYFGDTIFIEECENIIRKTTWMESDIYKKIEGYPMIWIGYDDDGTPYNGQDLTLEKYIEKREEALSNE